MSKKRKRKKVMAKVNYLVMEKEETDELYDEFNQKFNQDFQEELEFLQLMLSLEKYEEELRAENDESEKEESEDEESESVDDGDNEESEDGEKAEESEEDINVLDSSNVVSNKSLNKLFRKVASKTHPDVSKLENPEKIFMKAKKAHNEEDWITLIAICLEYGIELPDFTEEELEMIDNYSFDLQKKIEMKRRDDCWFWNNTTDEERTKYRKTFHLARRIDDNKFEEYKKNKSEYFLKARARVKQKVHDDLSKKLISEMKNIKIKES
jgi:hypothetical protein